MQVVTDTKIVNSTALLAAVAAAAASSPASAADLIMKASPMSTFAPTWQGLYVGGSIGASWLNSTQDDGGVSLFGYYGGSGASQKANSLGFLAGLQAGYNFQDRNFVYGLEADISWAGGAKATTTSTFANYSGYSGTKTSQIDGLATFRARFGYDFGGTMPYFTFGVAVGDIKNTYSVAGYNGAARGSVSKSSWQPGLALGGGIEHRFSNSPWSIKGEVLWVGFKDTKLDAPSQGVAGYATTGNVKFSNDLVLGRIGLNYRF
jgi:outer membrane immunogenic protein